MDVKMPDMTRVRQVIDAPRVTHIEAVVDARLRSLALEEMDISTPLLDTAAARDDLDVVERLGPITFDAEGVLKRKFTERA
jgi:hypothetical protein